MKIISGKCPNCSAPIQIGEDVNQGYCTYCNTPFFVDNGELKRIVILTKNTQKLLKRAYILLEDGEFESVQEKLDVVFDEDPENADAWLAMFMAEHRVRRKEDLERLSSPFDNDKNFNRALRFASPKLRDELNGYNEAIKKRNNRIDEINADIMTLNMNSDQFIEKIENCIDEMVPKFEEWKSSKDDKDFDKLSFIFAVATMSGAITSLTDELTQTKDRLLHLKDELSSLRSKIIENSEKRLLSVTQISDGFGKWHDVPIEWKLLWQDGKKALFITKDCIDAGVYNPQTNTSGTSWIDSSIRKFLNEELFYTAFTDDEKRLIITTENISADGTAADNLFVLSCDEAEKYMSSKNERIAKGTAPAINKGVFVTGDGRTCWWLRSNNKFSENIPIVDMYGDIDGDGIAADTEDCGIRPAVWIALK